MSERKVKSQEHDSDREEESLLDLLRRCPIDEETWAYILDRPNDLPREISFDDLEFDNGEDEKPDHKTEVERRGVVG